MTFPSKYEGKCKDCGTEHKIGDQIGKNRNGNYCRNGENCSATMQLEGKITPPTTGRSEVPIEQIVAEITAIRGAMTTQSYTTNTNIDGSISTQGDAQIIEAPLTSEMVEGIWKYAISRKMSR